LQGASVKYAFVERHRSLWPISVQCRVLRISLTGYEAQGQLLGQRLQRDAIRVIAG
jgi:hypothetical protein